MKRRILQITIYILILVLTGAFTVFSGSFIAGAAVVFCILLPAVSTLINLHTRKNLAAEFSLPVTASKNETFSAEVILKNSGKTACLHALVSIGILNDLTSERSSMEIEMSAPANGIARCPLMISSSKCGGLTLSIENVKLYDWFGFIPVNAPVTAKRGILIKPDTFPSDINVSLPYSEETELESSKHLKGIEDPTEIYGFREYQAGDPVKRIHWKLSAKRDAPILKEVSMPVSRSLLLFWKKESGTSPDAEDALAEAFSSVALSLTSRGISFTMGWSDRSGEHYEMITNEEAALEAVPLSVKYGAVKDHTLKDQGRSEDPGEKYQNTSSVLKDSLSSYSKILWFSGKYPFDLESDIPPGSVCFICSEEPKEAGSHYTLSFAPEDTVNMFTMLSV